MLNNSAFKIRVALNKYINHFYNINDDINKKIKVSKLIKRICNSLFFYTPEIDKSQFKITVENCLNDIGLKKTRYENEVYYYGIDSKHGEWNYDSEHDEDKDNKVECKINYFQL